jgi:hypothetical protein
MIRSIPAVLVLLSLPMATAADARTRAVRHPAPTCAFSLSSAFGTSVTAAGLDDGAISVIANPSTCTSWNAYSLTSWITVVRNGNTAWVDVAPNPTNTPRSGTLLIAGIRHTINQEASVVISPPIAGNVLVNGGFDRDLSPWGWQSRFPNGPGTASWSTLDARNNPNSGSIRLVNTRPADQGHTFQQLQCVAVEASEIYEYGGSFLATSTTAVSAVFSIVEYADEGCNVAAVSNEAQTPRSRTPGAWQTESYTKRMGPTTKSAFVVIGNLARVAGTYEIFVDDVFLKKR